MNTLELRDISFSPGPGFRLEVPAFELRCAELVALIGHNGAGKSTLVKIITGGLRPDVGQIWFQNLDVTRSSMTERVRRGLHFTPQYPPPIHDLSVAQIGAAYGRPPLAVLSQMPPLAVRESFQQLPFAIRKLIFTEWSLQKVRPGDLVLLDEPTAGVSEQWWPWIAEQIQTVRATATVLIIEHRSEFLSQWPCRTVRLANGRLIDAP